MRGISLVLTRMGNLQLVVSIADVALPLCAHSKVELEELQEFLSKDLQHKIALAPVWERYDCNRLHNC